MNRSSEVSIGFVYLSNCSLPVETTSNDDDSDWKIAIGFIVGSMMTIVLISVTALCKKVYAQRLRRSRTVRSHLNQLAQFELQC